MLETVLDILLDAVLDTLAILPFLLAMHILLEVYEYKAGSKLRSAKLLNGKAAPLLGAGVGLIPQCGFSVVATKLYTTKRISLAALIAVYISTSDEAIPVLLSNPSAALKLIPLLLIKLGLALIAAYSILIITSLLNRKNPAPASNARGDGGVDQKSVPEAGVHNCGCEAHKADAAHSCNTDEQSAAAHTCETPEVNAHAHTCGCKTCGAKVPQTFTERFLLHPSLRTLKILAFIFAVNLGMGIIITLIGEDRLTGFLEQASYAQVPLAALVGLIPNCASSVVITQLYALGDLSLGACVAGLSINSGVAFTVLIKENKSLKQSIMIIAGLFIYAVAAGIIITTVTGI